MELSEEAKNIVRELSKTYFDFERESINKIFAELDTASALVRPSDVKAVLASFRHSITSAIAAIAMPHDLAWNSVKMSHLDRIHSAERIRAMSYADLLSTDGNRANDPAKEKIAFEKAHSRFMEFFRSRQGAEIMLGDLARVLLDPGFCQSAPVLLEQGVVLIWSAFEVLSRDTFELILNASPEKAKDLIENQDTRKRFQADKLPLDTLLQYGFDLSQKLGTVLVKQRDFSDLCTIKAVYSVLFPQREQLRKTLSDPKSWLLCQRRHLVVHRRCVVDQDYLEATGESHELGAHLVVTPQDIESSLEVVVSVAVELSRALSPPTSDPVPDHVIS